ncbi:MAG TPA: DUF4349 domain-containing protein [Bacteroidia bacterium]|jgi:hypothetical protein
MKKIAYSFAFSLIFLSSCQNKSSDFDSTNAKEGGFEFARSEQEPPPPPPVMETVKFSPPVVSDEETLSGLINTNSTGGSAMPAVKMAEKIKKTADINLSVDDYKAARAGIEKIVKAGNAYIGGENEQHSTYSISNSMVIRVSNKEFDGMVSNLTAIASNLNSKNIYLEDVTAQFIDITTRLKTKKEVEKRYLELLQKAVKVSDILEVEGQLRVIREEIEAKEGELKYLNDQVNYSTINLEFHQDFEYTPQNEPGFFGRMGHAFGNGWKGFLSFLIGVVYAWPLWIILGLTAYFIVRFIKRKVKKK